MLVESYDVDNDFIGYYFPDHIKFAGPIPSPKTNHCEKR